MAHFEQPFAEIWRLIPFKPSAQELSFVARFTEDGCFDAERFWEYVAVATGAVRPHGEAAKRSVHA